MLTLMVINNIIFLHKKVPLPVKWAFFSKKKNGPTSTIWISMVMRQMLPVLMNNIRVPEGENKNQIPTHLARSICSFPIQLLLRQNEYVLTQ
jgi:hypothetical protein